MPDVGGEDTGPSVDAEFDVPPDVEDVDAAEDTVPDLEPDLSVPDVPPSECSSGVECVRLSDCDGVGLSSPQCLDGCCVEGAPPARQCASHGASCAQVEQTTNDFFCDVGSGQCLQRCDFGDARNTQSADCPLNSHCLDQLPDAPDGTLDGVCVDATCGSDIVDPDACAPDETCLPWGNGASYCVVAGEVDEGGACTSGADDVSEVCGSGLLCLHGRCVAPCDRRRPHCGDAKCVGVFVTTPRNQPGVCGGTCEPFSDGCGEGLTCHPVFGRFGLTDWLCVEDGREVVGEGRACLEPGRICEEGLVCSAVDSAEARCVTSCDPLEASDEHYASCPRGDACAPSRTAEIGFCLEGCTPYPRRPGEYECASSLDTCLPFVARTDIPVEPQGYCSEDDGFAQAGEECRNDGTVGGECRDFAVCIDLDDRGAAECLPLCESFSELDCPDRDTCSGIPPIAEQLNFSFCITDAQPGAIGDRCTDEGLPCAADDSICLDMGGGPSCLAVCREGFDDCAEFAGRCNTGDLNPDVVPSYMGLCR